MARWTKMLLARFRAPILLRPLGRARDEEIDAALARAGMRREDIFNPEEAVLPHRGRMARMLAAFGIDVPRAMEERWNDLKRAEHDCAYCASARRCWRWLEWGRANDAPRMFCPNARLFAEIAHEQGSGPESPRSGDADEGRTSR